MELGADDYMYEAVRHVSVLPRELLDASRRAVAATRTAARAAARRDRGRRSASIESVAPVYSSAAKLRLTRTEFDLLAELAAHGG